MLSCFQALTEIPETFRRALTFEAFRTFRALADHPGRDNVKSM